MCFRTRIRIFSVLFLSCFLFSMAFSSVSPDFSNAILKNIDLNSSSSTNPGAPVGLSDGSYVEDQFYITGQYYYYSTYTMSSADYHLISFYNSAPSQEYDLYLYASGATYVTKRSTNSQWDWIVYRPASNEIMYPRIRAESGSLPGVGIIEAESGIDIGLDTVYNWTYSPIYERFELYEINLTAGTTYTVFVARSTGDLDLFVCHIAPGSEDSSSTSVWQGVTQGGYKEEYVTFDAPYTDDYAIVVIRKDNTFGYAVTVQVWEGGYSDIPGFESLYIALAFILTLVGYKKNKQLIQQLNH